MTRQFKLYKIAGPSGTFAGYVLLISGIVSSIFVISGILIFIVGLYLAFGYYYSTINVDKRRIKRGFKLFGFTISGKSTDIDDSYMVQIEKTDRHYKLPDNNNQGVEIENAIYIVKLFSQPYSKMIEVALCRTLTEANEKAAIVKDLLQLKS